MATARAAQCVKSVFRTYDQTGSGLISKDELKEALKLLPWSRPPTDLELDTLLRSLKSSDDGQLWYDHFVDSVFGQKKAAVSRQRTAAVWLSNSEESEPCTDSITVFVSDMHGEVLSSVEAVPSHPVSVVFEQLRLRVQDCMYPRLLLAGQVLAEDRTFEEYGLTSSSTLTLDWAQRDEHGGSGQSLRVHPTLIAEGNSTICLVVVDTDGTPLGSVEVLVSHPVSFMWEHFRLRKKDGLHPQLMFGDQHLAEDQTFEACGVTSGATLRVDWVSHAQQMPAVMRLCSTAVTGHDASVVSLQIVDDADGASLGSVDVLASHPVSLIWEHLRLRKKEGLHPQLVFGDKHLAEDLTFAECGLTSDTTLKIAWVSHVEQTPSVMRICSKAVDEHDVATIIISIVDASDNSLLGNVEALPSHPVSLVWEQLRLRAREALRPKLCLEGRALPEDHTFEECSITSHVTLSLAWAAADPEEAG